MYLLRCLSPNLPSRLNCYYNLETFGELEPDRSNSKDTFEKNLNSQSFKSFEELFTNPLHNRGSKDYATGKYKERIMEYEMKKLDLQIWQVKRLTEHYRRLTEHQNRLAEQMKRSTGQVK